MRGFFGIGVEGISKQFNVGNLFRSAHAFGASFVFTVDSKYSRSKGGITDTSDSLGALPFYSFPKISDLVLPNNCQLVGVELVDNSIPLPSFRHPVNAAYILGPERGCLSQETLSRCAYTVQIPTKFCLNVGIAGVLAMYDRLLCMGRFDPRPVRTGGPTEKLEKPTFGKPFFLRDAEKFKSQAPLAEVKIAEQGYEKE